MKDDQAEHDNRAAPADGQGRVDPAGGARDKSGVTDAASHMGSSLLPVPMSALRPVLETILALAVTLAPGLAHAQSVGGFGDGVTQLLKMVVNLVVFEWGYYLGIILLAIQGYRWKTGRCDLMELGRWGLGIMLVFFAPNIVGDIRGRAGGVL